MKFQFRTIALLLIALLALSVSVVAAQGDDGDGDDDMMDMGAVVVLNADSATVSETELMLDGVFPKAAATLDIMEDYIFYAFDYYAFEGAFTWVDAPHMLDAVTIYVDSDEAAYTLVAMPLIGDGEGEAETIVSNWEVVEFVSGVEYSEDGNIELDKPDITDLTNVSVFVTFEGDAVTNFVENFEAWLDEFRITTGSCVPGVSC